MRRVLPSWIGHTDLRAPEETDLVGVGPVAQALDARLFDQAFLLTDHAEERIRRYREWLAAHAGGTTLSLVPVSLRTLTEITLPCAKRAKP